MVVGTSALVTEVFYATYLHRYEGRQFDRRFKTITLIVAISSVFLAEVIYVVLGFRSFAQAIYIGVSVRVVIIGAPEFVYFTLTGRKKLNETREEYVATVKQRLKFHQENLAEMGDRVRRVGTDDPATVANIMNETQVKIRELRKLLEDMGDPS